MDDKNIIKWNHANGIYLGTEYIFKNQIIISTSLNYYKLNYYKHDVNSYLITAYSDFQKTTTFFHGKIDYVALDLSFGYSFKISDNSSLQLKLGAAHFVKFNTKIIESYQETQHFQDTPDEESTSFLTTRTFFNGTSDYELDQSFKDRFFNIKLIPSINLNYRYSFTDRFSLDLFSRYTLSFGYRIGAGIIYKLKKNDK
ncbi:MAG: hypothetical protein R3277_02130 [Brumimicrobium sp.]|nr:hypothetical protein [Brumimicrobium sp.]